MCSHFMATSSGRNVLCSCRFGFLQHRAACELMKSLAQILQGTVDARSDGVEFAAEKSGNFLILQFLKAAEKRNFPFFFRKRWNAACNSLTSCCRRAESRGR